MSTDEAWERAGAGHVYICPDIRSSGFILRGMGSDQRLCYGESYPSDLHSTAGPLAAAGDWPGRAMQEVIKGAVAGA